MTFWIRVTPASAAQNMLSDYSNAHQYSINDFNIVVVVATATAMVTETHKKSPNM